MPRTTLDIAAPILRELKRLQKRERKTLGELVSELLAETLTRRHGTDSQKSSFTWTARDMGARVDLADKDQLWAILDRQSRSP